MNHSNPRTSPQTAICAGVYMNDGISLCSLHKPRFDKLLELDKLLLALGYDIAKPVELCRDSPLVGKRREGKEKAAQCLLAYGLECTASSSRVEFSHVAFERIVDKLRVTIRFNAKRGKATSNTASFICKIQCADRRSHRDQKISCFRDFHRRVTPNSWCRINRAEICIPLIEWQPFGHCVV